LKLYQAGCPFSVRDTVRLSADNCRKVKYIKAMCTLCLIREIPSDIWKLVRDALYDPSQSK